MYRYEKNISVEAQIYDVIVVGGGSAGICAAIASARQGAKTLLVEDTGWLGGIGTTAAMVEFGPIVRGGLRVVGGIPYELMQRMRTFGGAELRDDTEDLLFAPETFAHVAMLMCEEAGVELLLHTRMIDTIREGDAITGILLQDKEGMRYLADCGVDGIISTKGHIIRTAKELGFLTVQRFFALDSQGMGVIQDTLKNNPPHLMEIMPGVIPKAIKRFADGQIPVIAGGLIETRQEVTAALSAGALAVSTGCKELWYE